LYIVHYNLYEMAVKSVNVKTYRLTTAHPVRKLPVYSYRRNAPLPNLQQLATSCQQIEVTDLKNALKAWYKNILACTLYNASNSYRNSGTRTGFQEESTFRFSYFKFNALNNDYRTIQFANDFKRQESNKRPDRIVQYRHALGTAVILVSLVSTIYWAFCHFCIYGNFLANFVYEM